jgi:hypothetical protein
MNSSETLHGQVLKEEMKDAEDLMCLFEQDLCEIVLSERPGTKLSPIRETARGCSFGKSCRVPNTYKAQCDHTNQMRIGVIGGWQLAIGNWQ